MPARPAVAVAGLVALLSGLLTGAAATPAKSASTFGGTPAVGALFFTSAINFHFCTASVVRSHDHSVIATAAHCVRGGTAAGYEFAPGYHDGKAPYGMWRVVAAYAPPAWIRRTDVHDDLAFLRVAPRRINGTLTRLQTVTGGNRLGVTASGGQRITVAGYPLGFGGSPIHCRTHAFVKGRFRGFHCGGFADGTSGAPWVAGRTVVGVLGGLHQGGCTAATSYSSPIGRAAHRALHRAGYGKPGDVFPNPPSDGC
jgi:V8-like Glu-specific endopeptidase